jgi:DNA-directed RNA polymerase subunit RPC12/RpoP
MSETSFFCSHCAQRLSADDDMAGETIDCPSCSKTVTIPGTARTIAPTQKACPFCAEPIQMKATRCKHCGADLETTKRFICYNCQQVITFSKDLFEQAQRVYSPFACPKCKCAVLVPGSPSASTAVPVRVDGDLITAGWVTSVLIPIVGFILGILLLARGRRIDHGIAILIFSLVMCGFWAAFWPAFWAAVCE